MRTLEEINDHAAHDGYAAARRFLAHYKPDAAHLKADIEKCTYKMKTDRRKCDQKNQQEKTKNEATGAQNAQHSADAIVKLVAELLQRSEVVLIACGGARAKLGRHV